MPYSITREDAAKDAEAVRQAIRQSPLTVEAYEALAALADSIEEQAVPQEPTGDVTVFFTMGHPRAGTAYCPDGGLWDGDNESGLTWAAIVGTGKAENVMLYRRVEYPEVGPFTEEEIDQQLATANRRLHGQRFCTGLTQNCRLADGHTDGCKP